MRGALLALVLPRFFLASFRSSLTTESLEQATFLPANKCVVTKLRTNRNVRGKQRSSGVVVCNF